MQHRLVAGVDVSCWWRCLSLFLKENPCLASTGGDNVEAKEEGEDDVELLEEVSERRHRLSE